MSSKLDVTKNTTKRAEVQYQLKQFGFKIPAFFERSHDEKSGKESWRSVSSQKYAIYRPRIILQVIIYVYSGSVEGLIYWIVRVLRLSTL